MKPTRKTVAWDNFNSNLGDMVPFFFPLPKAPVEPIADVHVRLSIWFVTVSVSRTCAGRDLRPQPAHLNWHKRGLERESVNHTRIKSNKPMWGVPQNKNQSRCWIKFLGEGSWNRYVGDIITKKRASWKQSFYRARVDSGRGHAHMVFHLERVCHNVTR